MIEGKRILAIIPARRGSKGLPGKNIRPLAGKPLLAWPITAAKGSVYVDRIILSTDDAEFAEIGRRHGAEAPFLRPAELASDNSPSIDFLLHVIDTLEAAGDRYDYVVLLEPTSPLTRSSDVDAALERLVAAAARADALVGVAELVTSHPAFAVRIAPDGRIRPFAAAGFDNLPRRQDLEPLFVLDGSIYVSSVAALRRERGFCHAGTIAYEMARHKALEIDDLVDFVCVEAILNNLDLIERAESSADRN